MTPGTTTAGPLPAGRPSVEAVRLPVAGMTCSACVGAITRAVRRLDGVTRVRVDLGAETVTVDRVAGSASDSAIAAAITEAGYHPDVGSADPVPAHVARGLLDRWLRRTS